MLSFSESSSFFPASIVVIFFNIGAQEKQIMMCSVGNVRVECSYVIFTEHHNRKPYYLLTGLSAIQFFARNWPNSTAMGNLSEKMHEHIDFPEDHGVNLIGLFYRE